MGDTIPGIILAAPRGGRADIKARGNFDSATGQWTVILNRGLTSNSATRDVQFDLSVDANLYGFSVATIDNGGGGLATMAPQDFKAYSLGNENSGADLQAQMVVDEPTSAADFSGPSLTTTPLDPSGAAPATLQAAYDDDNVYIMAMWTDLTSTESVNRKQWEFDGADWSQPSGRSEDRVVLMFDINTTDWGAGGQGCGLYCHLGETPGDDGRMRTNNPGETLDMWHWKAARTNPIGFSDDKYVIYAAAADTTTKTRKSESGDSADNDNEDSTGALPASMADGDPAANATYLFDVPDGSDRAVTFVP